MSGKIVDAAEFDAMPGGKIVSAEEFDAMPLTDRRGQLEDDAILREKLNALPTEAIHNMVLTDPVSGARSRLAYELLEKDNPAEFTGISDARGLGAVDKHLGHKTGDDFVQKIVEAHKEEGIPVYRASDKGDEFLTRWNGLTKEQADVKLKAVNDRLRNSDLIVENPDGSKRYFTNLELYTALGRDYNEAGQILGERKRTGQPAGFIKGEFPRHLVELTEAEWMAKTRGKGESASGTPENLTSEVAPSATQSTREPRPAVSDERPLSLREQAKKQFVERFNAQAVTPTEQPLHEQVKKRFMERFAERTAAPMEELPQGDIAAGGIAFGQELPKYSSGNTSINLERIDTDYPVKYLIDQVADQFKGKIDKTRRGEITHEETRKLADALGMTESDLLSRRKGQAFNAEEATAARDILNTSAKRLVEQQKKAVESGSDADLVNFRLALSRHAAIQAEVSGVATEAGRALSAHRILSKSISQTAKNQKAMLDALGGREVTEDITRAMSQVDMSNVAEVNRFIRAFSKVKKSDMIFEAWINFLLSGPKTHIVNTVSNTLTYLTKAPETAVASVVDIIRAKMGGTPRERFFGEVAADFVGARVGLVEGVRASLRAFREEMPGDALLKMEQARYKAIPGKVGEIVRLPGRFLTAADEFYKSVNYTSELYALSYRKAAKEGATGKRLTEKTAEYVQDPSPEMIEAAKHEAQYRTFTQPYGKWGRILERTRQILGVRYLVPFMRTPTNIAKFALERTPGNFVRIAYKVKQGEIKGSQLSDELAKPILGSMIGAVVVALAQDGLITSGGPKSKAERDTLYRAGWQPYAFKIDGKYYSYGRLEPVGSIFGMAADFAELTHDTDDKELMDYAESIALSISKNLTSKTFMKGLSSALDAVSDPKRYGENWVESMAGSLVPSVVNTAARMSDDVVRDVHGPREAMQARIPYLSRALCPKRDLWGREIKYDGSAIERGFSPVSISTESTDPVDREMQRLGINPGLPQRNIKGISLSPIQYDIYLQFAGQEAYRKASEIVNDKSSDDFGDETKAWEIKSAIQNARRNAAEDMYEFVQGEKPSSEIVAEMKSGKELREAKTDRQVFRGLKPFLRRQVLGQIEEKTD